MSTPYMGLGTLVIKHSKIQICNFFEYPLVCVVSCAKKQCPSISMFTESQMELQNMFNMYSHAGHFFFFFEKIGYLSGEEWSMKCDTH